MGRLPTGKRKYQIKEVQAQHREMLRRIARGDKNVDIAKDMDITPVTVSIVRNSEVSKQALRELEAKRDEEVLAVKGEMSRLGKQATKVLDQVLYNEEAGMSLRVNTAKYVLSCIGAEEPKRVQGEITTKVVDADMLREIKKTALEEARLAGILPAVSGG